MSRTLHRVGAGADMLAAQKAVSKVFSSSLLLSSLELSDTQVYAP